jgi:uncharacterized protein GlcG (DUF336 family)
MEITLQQAESLVAAARERAATIGVAASIAVLDSAGHIKAFSRMDRAWLGSIDVAIRKAKSSVLFETETQMIWEVCNPVAQAHGLELTNDGLVTFAGGIPLKSTDGRVIGAIGVSGGQVSQDFEIAQAGAAAIST